MSKSVVFKADIECQSCGGTGLYVGMAERNGAAVVCHTCKGTGCEKFELKYEPFVKRKVRKDVKRVFKDSCGYCQSAEDVTVDDGKISVLGVTSSSSLKKTIKFSEGGATYKDWQEGAEPKPVKDLYCPYLWTGQGMQMSDHPQHSMYEKLCSRGTSLGCRITECKFFKSKAACWETYEKAGGK